MPTFLLLHCPLFFHGLSLVPVFQPVLFYHDLSSPASSWAAFLSQSFSRACLSACVILCRSFFYLAVRLSFSVFFSCLSFCLCHLYADLSSPDSSRTAFLSVFLSACVILRRSYSFGVDTVALPRSLLAPNSLSPHRKRQQLKPSDARSLSPASAVVWSQQGVGCYRLALTGFPPPPGRLLSQLCWCLWGPLCMLTFPLLRDRLVRVCV